MTTLETPRLLRHTWKTVLAWGVLTLIAGAVVLVWPGISVTVVSILFGAWLVVSGIAQMVFAFTLDAVPAGNRVLLFISGALSLVLGVLAFRYLDRGYSIWLLAIWIGVGFIFAGVAEVSLAISYPQLPERGWHIFLGVITAMAGVVMLAWPFGSILVLAIVAGIWMVIIGITAIIWALRARKVIHDTQRKFEGLTAAPTTRTQVG